MEIKKLNKIAYTYIGIALLFLIVYQMLLFFYPNNYWFNTFLLLLFTVTFILFLLKDINSLTKYIKILKEENRSLSLVAEKYDIILKATRDTIWDWNVKEQKFSISSGITETFGYTPREVTNNIEWWFEKIHLQDSLKISVYIYATTDETQERWEDQYRFRCADGSYKYILDRGFVVRDSLGKVMRMVGVMQDITKQKTEELRLKLLETAITQTKDSILISEHSSTIAGIPRVVYANKAFTDITGYEQSEIIGSNPSIFLTKQSIYSYIRLIKNALKKETDFTFVGLNQKKNGKKYWIHFTMIPITDSNGKLSHWISIQRDITEDKEKEKEREQLITELIQNNKDLKQFSYITSHNLRAPLSNLIGLLNLIEEVPIENQELRELLEGFSTSTNLLNETINDLIKIIVIKDELGIEKEWIDIESIINKVKNQLSVLIESKGAEIILNLEATQIYANTIYFESIVLNLMTNALKYSKKEEKPLINIGSQAIDDSILFKFEDNGIGIDLNKNKSKIFGLYQRFHNLEDSKGLGLYLVKSQVESMQGVITIESEVGKGTTFEIVLKNK